MEMLAMDGYGTYVWSCFVLTFTIIVLNEWSARRRHRSVLREIEVRIKAIEERQ